MHAEVVGPGRDLRPRRAAGVIEVAQAQGKHAVELVTEGGLGAVERLLAQGAHLGTVAKVVVVVTEPGHVPRDQPVEAVEEALAEPGLQGAPDAVFPGVGVEDPRTLGVVLPGGQAQIGGDTDIATRLPVHVRPDGIHHAQIAESAVIIDGPQVATGPDPQVGDLGVKVAGMARQFEGMSQPELQLVQMQAGIQFQALPLPIQLAAMTGEVGQRDRR